MIFDALFLNDESFGLLKTKGTNAACRSDDAGMDDD